MPPTHAGGRSRGASQTELTAVAARLGEWGRELGFQRVGIAGVELGDDEARLLEWLGAGYHGEMSYMQRHGVLRSRPAQMMPGTVSVISARMDYLSGDGRDAAGVLADSRLGYVSRYALGRDYHKLMRKRLLRLAERIGEAVGEYSFRVFSDSAPVLEKPLARGAGLGWIGKHTNLLDRECGSWFFLGEIYTDLPLPSGPVPESHCGTCDACIRACPTGAIVAPYRLDARLCISYLTIELRGSIPVELRPLLGNRIYGCDDCQLVCPWNRFASPSPEPDFRPRHGLDAPDLVALFRWTAEDFDERTRGSAIRRVGHEGWLRNVAVALGNAPTSDPVVAALRERRDDPSALVREHVAWALERHGVPSA